MHFAPFTPIKESQSVLVLHDTAARLVGKFERKNKLQHKQNRRNQVLVVLLLIISIVFLQ